MQIPGDFPKYSPIPQRPPFWLKEITKEELTVTIDKELEKVTEVNRNSWKNTAQTIIRNIKDSREMRSLLDTAKTELCMHSSEFELKGGSQFFSVKSLRSALSDDADMDLYDNHQQQVVEDTSYYKPRETRIKAFRSLINSQPLDTVLGSYLKQLQHNLLDGLCDRDPEVFNICIGIHAKLVSPSSSPEIMKDSFLNLIEGLRSYYARKYQQQLPTCESGIDSNILIHSRVLRICHLILHTLKHMPKQWMKYGKSVVSDIVDAVLVLLTMHTYDSTNSKTLLYPFHILSVFDPEANRCIACFFGKFGYDTFLSKQARITVLLRYIAEEIGLYLNSPVVTALGNENSFSPERVKFCSFLHCVNILSLVGTFRSGQHFFPLSSKSSKIVYTLPGIFEQLLLHINERNSPVCTVTVRFITDAVMRLLNEKDSPLLSDQNFRTVILKPVEILTETCCDIPPHTLKILDGLCSSVHGRHCLLGVNALHEQVMHNLHSWHVGHFTKRQSMKNLFNDDKYAAQIPVQALCTLLKSKHVETNVIVLLLKAVTKLYKYPDAVVILSNSHVALMAPAVRMYKELSSIYNIDVPLSREHPTNPQSERLLSALREFLLEVASSPLGVVHLSQFDSLVSELMRSLVCAPAVLWQDYEVRRKVALLSAVPEGAATLAEDGGRAISCAMEKLWATYEHDDHIVKGLDRDVHLAEKEFISVVFSCSCTITGIEALLTEKEGSEPTLVEWSLNQPLAIVDLLTFDSALDPWHYTGLLVLRALVSTLDSWLYLESTLDIQKSLLKLQEENVVSPLAEEDEDGQTKSKRPIIIDECSMLRHQILMSTYVIGGPSERTIPSLDLDFDSLDDDDGPQLFCKLPVMPACSPTVRGTRSKVISELQKFLQDTRKGLHDSSWLTRARKAFKAASQETTKPAVLLELVEQLSECSTESQITINWPANDAMLDVELCKEEMLGIDAVVGYGIQIRQLQTCRPNTQFFSRFLLLIQVGLKYKQNVPKFKGFDWFAATVFLICAGNIEKCCSFLSQVASLPVAMVLWPPLAEANGISDFIFMFSQILESLVMVELPTLHGALTLAGVSIGLVCFSWIRQCFWNILDWTQVCHWLTLCVLHPPDMPLYFCVALLRHIQPSIIREAATGNVWEVIKLASVSGFRVGDVIVHLEDLVRRHRSRLLPKLQGSLQVQKRELVNNA